MSDRKVSYLFHFLSLGHETLSPSIIKTIKKIKKSDSGKEPCVLAFVHDMAGQIIYYETHYCFLRPNCPYILVHDLSRELDEPAHPRFKFEVSGKQRDLQNPFLFTNLDYLLMWLSALESLGREKTEAFSFGSPKVLIVLTNSDQFTGSIEDVEKRIKEVVSKRAGCNVLDEVYVINNTTSRRNGDAIRRLRRKLFEWSKEVLLEQPLIPIAWFNLEAALSKIQSENRMYVSLEEVKEVARQCNVKNVEDALTFLHHQCVLVHHPGSSKVVLNPAWLMGLFTEIITIPDVTEGSNLDHFQSQLKEGILKEDFFLQHLHGELLLEMLQRFNLICRWEYDEKPAFLVPSLAPIMARGKEIEEILRKSPATSVFIAFLGGHLPLGIFARLLVMLISRCQKYLRVKKPRFFCNYSLIPFGFGNGKLDVYLVKLPEKIKIGVVPQENVDQHCLRRFLHHLQSVLNGCLEEIEQDKSLFYSNIKHVFVVKCSACFGEREKCFRHKREKCYDDECGHFWDLKELQRFPVNPVCIYGDNTRTVEFVLDRVEPWLRRGKENDVFYYLVFKDKIYIHFCFPVSYYH